MVFGFLYFRQDTGTGGEDTGTNFFSQFNPFGTGTIKPPTVTPPTDISGYEPGEEIERLQLIKISSVPVAGFTVYQKERLKDVPVVETPVVEQSLGVPYDFGTATIKSGSTGEGVMELQRFLNTVLKINLELSGTVNTETLNAIKSWQTDHAITSDGIVGPKTKSAMYASVNQNEDPSEPTPPPTEFVASLRYVDRITGNIYQTFVDKIDERKFSGTVIPKVYEAFFGNNGQSVVMRYLKTDEKTIETFTGSLPEEHLGGDVSETNEVKGSLLPDDIKGVSVSPNTENMLYLFNSGDNTTVGTILNFSTEKKTQVFDSSFSEWLPEWPNSSMLTLTTKPSAVVPGHMYILDLNSSSKNLNRVLSGINGLTTLTSPNGKLVLYGNNSLSLSIFNTETKTIGSVGLRTLPEKCVWGKMSDVLYCLAPKTVDAGGYPDVWYQGEVSFEDQVWKIDVATGNTSMILDPITIEGGEEVDGIKLATDEGENYLFFVNKKDSFLWGLSLK